MTQACIRLYEYRLRDKKVVKINISRLLPL